MKCPICSHDSWCGISADGAVVRCMRVSSDRPSKGGFIHKVGETLADAAALPKAPKPEAPKLTTGELSAMLHQWKLGTTDAMVESCALALGVAASSLHKLGCVWAAPHQAWAWPMVDHSSRPVGIRLRANDGKKWAVRGSREGIFVPAGISARGTLYIVEGPTDTAALTSIKIDAIGRPSCQGAVGFTVDFLHLAHKRDVVILADRDKPHTRPDGAAWYPGREGAEALAKSIQPHCRSLKLIYPAAGKDARAWVRSGATREVVELVARNATFWTGK